MTSPPPAIQRLPGEAGIWVLVLGDMCVFGLFFGVFTYFQGLNPELYSQSQATLNTHYGAVNTLLLLLSSWLVVVAVDGLREGHNIRAAKFLISAFLCGAGFCVIKVIEYSEKISSGIGITTNEFFMYYYVLTGLHFLHVLIGMAVLIYLAGKTRRELSDKDIQVFESGAIFWHMVDLLWIVIFPLLYLVN